MPRIVTIGAAPTALGACFRLNDLKNQGVKEAEDVEIICLEQVKNKNFLKSFHIRTSTKKLEVF